VRPTRRRRARAMQQAPHTWSHETPFFGDRRIVSRRHGIRRKERLPSGRLLQFAGPVVGLGSRGASFSQVAVFLPESVCTPDRCRAQTVRGGTETRWSLVEVSFPVESRSTVSRVRALLGRRILGQIPRGAAERRHHGGAVDSPASCLSVSLPAERRRVSPRHSLRLRRASNLGVGGSHPSRRARIGLEFRVRRRRIRQVCGWRIHVKHMLDM